MEINKGLKRNDEINNSTLELIDLLDLTPLNENILKINKQFK